VHYSNTNKNIFSREIQGTVGGSRQPAIMQLPVSLSNGELYVVETDVRLPTSYTPAVGSFIAHPVLPGRLSVHWWGWDVASDHIVICLSVGYTDLSRNLDEWLNEHSDWRVADDPVVSLAPTGK
jgi:hypothetical protein